MQNEQSFSPEGITPLHLVIRQLRNWRANLAKLEEQGNPQEVEYAQAQIDRLTAELKALTDNGAEN